MSEIPLEYQIKFDEDYIKFKKYSEAIKITAEYSKQFLLELEFEPLPNDPKTEDYEAYVKQFIPWVLNLVLFPNLETFTKLKALGFTHMNFKCFSPLELIVNEIERLKNIKGLHIFPYMYLVSINEHLACKLLESMIERFRLHAFYNKRETNIYYQEVYEFYRRIEYNKSKNQIGKMNIKEQKLKGLLDKIENAVGDDTDAKKMFLKVLNGKGDLVYDCINTFHVVSISKRKVYLELFPLLKLVVGDDFEMLSEEDYDNSKLIGYKSYDDYKIHRVGKILQNK